MLPVTGPQAYARRPDASARSAQQAEAERTTSSARSGELAERSVRRVDGGGGAIRFPDHRQIHQQGVVPSRSLNDRRVAGADSGSHSKEKLNELLKQLRYLTSNRAAFADCKAVLENAQSQVADKQAWQEELINLVNEKLRNWQTRLDSNAGLDEIVRVTYCGTEVLDNHEMFWGKGFSLEDFKKVVESGGSPDDVLVVYQNPVRDGNGNAESLGTLGRLSNEVADLNGFGGEDRRQVTDAFIGACALRFDGDPLPGVMALRQKVVTGEASLTVRDVEAANLVLDRICGDGEKLFSEISTDLTTSVVMGVDLDSSKIKEYEEKLVAFNGNTAEFGLKYLIQWQTGDSKLADGLTSKTVVTRLREWKLNDLTGKTVEDVLSKEYGFPADEGMFGYDLETRMCDPKRKKIDTIREARSRMDDILSMSKAALKQVIDRPNDLAGAQWLIGMACDAPDTSLPSLVVAFKSEFGNLPSSSTPEQLAKEILDAHQARIKERSPKT